MRTLIAAAAALALGSSVSSSAPPTETSDVGALLFGKRCASCHGKDGRGNEKMAKALTLEPTGLDFGRPSAQKLTDEDLASALRKGKGKMPALGRSMKDDEVASLLAHVRRLRAAAGASAP